MLDYETSMQGGGYVMRHLGKLITIFVIAIIALLFQFGLQQPQWAQLLISLTGLVLAISMFIEIGRAHV